VPDRKRGGAVLAGDPIGNHEKWFWKRAEDEVRIITLQNPFEDPLNWKFECEVMWERPSGDDPARLLPSNPCYFALTAGDIQVGVVYSEWPYGGGRGARIFRQASPMANLGRLLGEYLETRIAPKPKRKRPRKIRDHGPLPSWNKAVPYRLRLECEKGVVQFHLRPVEGPALAPLTWEGLLLTKRFGRRELEEAWKGAGGTKPFRIVSLVRCHLREVVIEGRR
jgi:hypothetical protein